MCFVTGYNVNFKRYMPISETLNRDEMMSNYDVMFDFLVFTDFKLFEGWIPEEYQKNHNLYLANFFLTKNF